MHDPGDRQGACGQARSLVLRGPAHASASGFSPRPLASFLAQLVACERGLPPYRARRRAEPSHAAASYGGASPPGQARFERLL